MVKNGKILRSTFLITLIAEVVVIYFAKLKPQLELSYISTFKHLQFATSAITTFTICNTMNWQQLEFALHLGKGSKKKKN